MSGVALKLVVVACVLCLQGVVAGKLPREVAPASDTTAVPLLSDVLSRAQETITHLASQTSTLLGVEQLPSQDEIRQTLTTKSAELTEKINLFIGRINQEVKAHNGSEFNDLLQSISTNLNTAVANLQASTPGVTKQASEIQGQITSSLSTVVEEAKKLATALGAETSTAQENLDKLTRSAVEQAVTLGKQVEASVKTALEGHQAGHE